MNVPSIILLFAIKQLSMAQNVSASLLATSLYERCLLLTLLDRVRRAAINPVPKQP
jgi:hypothetical protein